MLSALARAITGLNRSIDSAIEQLILAREKPSEADGMQSGADQRLDERNAGFDADRRLLVLQPVPRPNLDDAHLFAHNGLTSPNPRNRGARPRRVRRLPARYRRPCILSVSARPRTARG